MWSISHISTHLPFWVAGDLLNYTFKSSVSLLLKVTKIKSYLIRIETLKMLPKKFGISLTCNHYSGIKYLVSIVSTPHYYVDILLSTNSVFTIDFWDYRNTFYTLYVAYSLGITSQMKVSTYIYRTADAPTSVTDRWKSVWRSENPHGPLKWIMYNNTVAW